MAALSAALRERLGPIAICGCTGHAIIGAAPAAAPRPEPLRRAWVCSCCCVWGSQSLQVK